MKNKRYILLIRTKDMKYEGYYRYNYRLFENYRELQKHLFRFDWIEKNNFVIFEETNLTRENKTRGIL